MEPIRGGAAGGLYDNPGYTKGSTDHLHGAEGHEYFVLQKGILGENLYELSLMFKWLFLVSIFASNGKYQNKKKTLIR